MARPAVLWSAIVIAAAGLACGGSTQQDVIVPSGDGRCQMSLTMTGPLPAAGGQTTGQLSAPRECVWSGQSTADWLQFDPMSGQGAGTLTFTAGANPLGRSRAASITVNEHQFSVAQEASPCRFEVSPSTLAMGHRGGRTTLHVTTLEGCVWTAQGSQPWVRVAMGGSGESSSSVEVAVDSNPGPERSGTIVVGPLIVVVNQQAGPDDRTECRFSVHPGSHILPSTGGQASFNVSTLPACSWHAASSQPWIVVLSVTNPIGSSEVHYRVEPNTSTSVRSGVITAGTRRHIVQQEGAPRR